MDHFRHAPFCTISFILALLFCVLNAAPLNAQLLSDRLDRAKVLFVDGQKAYMKGDLAKALKCFREAHRFVPSAELAYNIGHISEQIGNFEDAIRFLGLYLSRSRAPVKDQKEIERRMARLRVRVRAQRAQLIRELRTAPQDNEQAQEVFRRAIAMVKQGRHQAALVLFTIALDRYQIPEIHYNIAKLAEMLGRTRDAVRNYRAYLKKRDNAADRETVEKQIARLAEIIKE